MSKRLDFTQASEQDVLDVADFATRAYIGKPLQECDLDARDRGNGDNTDGDGEGAFGS